MGMSSEPGFILAGLVLDLYLKVELENRRAVVEPRRRRCLLWGLTSRHWRHWRHTNGALGALIMALIMATELHNSYFVALSNISV